MVQGDMGCSDVIYPAGFWLFAASPADDFSMELARQYLHIHSLTMEEVGIVNRDNQIVIITKKELSLNG